MISSVNVFQLIRDAGIFVQLIMLLLCISSVASWAIILKKYFSLKKQRDQDNHFFQFYQKSNSLQDLFQLKSSHWSGSFFRIFNQGIEFIENILKQRGDQNMDLTLSIVYDTLENAIKEEEMRLDRSLILLAIASSASPFLGLLGTVWGIMHSFYDIGFGESVGLKTIAPGIAEALITTLMGLVVAIPALVFYNYYVNRIKKQEVEMEHFATDLVKKIKINFLMKNLV